MSTRPTTLDSYTHCHSFTRSALRANQAGAKTQAHLKRALAEIDGLFTGLNYLDKVEPSHLGSSEAPNEPPTTAFSDKLQPDLDSLLPGPNDLPPTNTRTPLVPQGPDWSAIQNVRHGMEEAWKEFDKLATELNIDVINTIREQYDDAKGLREAGVVAFRNTLTGPTPSTLEHIFAFTSLSFVVSNLLRSRARLEDSDAFSGIHIWLNAIQDLKEQDAFILVAKRLWPEASNHLHVIPVQMSEKRQAILETMRNQDQLANPLDFNTRQYNNVDTSGVLTTPWQGNFDPTPIHGLYMDATQPYSVWHPCTAAPETSASRLTTETPREFHFSPVPAGECHPSDKGKDDALFSTAMSKDNSMLPIDTSQWDCDPDPIIPVEQRSTEIGSIEDLRKTKTFQVFLIFFHELDPLLYDLSGGGMTCLKNNQQLLAYQQNPRIRFRIEEELLARLLIAADSKDSRYQAIAGIAERFVERGYLQDVEKVKTYMFSLGQKIMDDSSYKQFFEWISDSKWKSRRHSDMPRRRTERKILKRLRKEFSCPNCKKKFTRKYNMQRHQRDVHKTVVQNSSPTPEAGL